MVDEEIQDPHYLPHHLSGRSIRQAHMAVRDLSHTAHIESLNLPQRHRWFRNHTLDLREGSPPFSDVFDISLPVATSTAASFRICNK